MSKKIAVIGAGVSGLTTAFCLKQQQLDFAVFEAAGTVGGVWHQKAYNELFLISSRNSTYLCGSRPPESYPDFPSAAQWQTYLEDYASGLSPHIHTNSPVSLVEPKGDGFRVVAGGAEQHFDAVVVCTGLNQIPRMPTFPGNFSGKIYHSADYRHHNELIGRKVLVIGEGNSGADIAVEAGRVANKAAISVRTSAWIIPKYAMGMPATDLQRAGSPMWLQKLFLSFMIASGSGSPDKFGLPKPDHRLFERTMVVSQQFPYSLRHGLIDVRTNVERFDGNTVHFVDGQWDEYDTIICATGFDYKLDYIQGVDLQPDRARLFRRLFVQGHPRLFINGFYVNNGAFTQVANLTAQLIASCIANPDRARRVIDRDMARHPEQFSDHFVIPNRNRHTKDLTRLHRQIAGKPRLP